MKRTTKNSKIIYILCPASVFSGVIVMGMLLLTLTLASAMYSGENETFDMGFEIINCSIINNSFDLDGLNWIIDNTSIPILTNKTYKPNTFTTNVTISTVINYKPDNFSISCWVWKYGEEVKKNTRRRSSNSRISGICQTDWVCSPWTTCDGKDKTRTCEKIQQSCEAKEEKPIEKEYCGSLPPIKITDDDITIGTDDKDLDKGISTYQKILGILSIIIVGILVYGWFKIKVLNSAGEYQ